MKGQILTHSIVVGFGVLVVVSVIILMGSIETNYKVFILDNEAENFCSFVRSSILNIYSPNYYSSNYSFSRADLNFPEKLAGFRYKATFNDSSMVIEIIEEPKNTFLCEMLVDADYLGSTTGGLTRIRIDKNAQRDWVRMKKL